LHQALYRKWRPQSFHEVIGQEAITSTLKNQAESGRLSHAYLFCGTRGSGKTTCARLVAKAMNCENLQGGEPCLACPSCLEIARDSLDIIEIDAASNNGVNNIRDLRDEVVFTPIHLRKKVYIIDEVHMLSTAAFNALLKTLEEPPAHVAFILATTETHKVPATILSRCQRFDFRRIPPALIAERLSFIAAAESFSFTAEALSLIARLSDGAMRNALSILEQVGGRAEGQLDEVAVRALLGLSGSTEVLSLVALIEKQDAPAAIAAAEDLYAKGIEAASLVSQLFSVFMDVLLYKAAGDSALLSGAGYDEAVLKELASKFSDSRLQYSLDTLHEFLNSMARGGTLQGQLYLLLFRLCTPEGTGTAALEARVESLEKKLAAGLPLAAAPKQSPAAAKEQPAAAPQSPSTPKAAAAPTPQTVNTEDTWAFIQALLSALSKKLDRGDFSHLQNANITLSGTTLTIAAKGMVGQQMLNTAEIKQVISLCAREIYGSDLIVTVAAGAAQESGASALKSLFE